MTAEFIWVVTANDYIIILVWPCHARFISQGGAYIIFVYISLDHGTAAEFTDLIDTVLLILLIKPLILDAIREKGLLARAILGDT